MNVPLSSDLRSPDSVPYFLWAEPMTVAELRARLASGSDAERSRFLGKILREARDTDVWYFTTPRELAGNWNKIERYLGRRRRFWTFLMRKWKELGLIE